MAIWILRFGLRRGGLMAAVALTLSGCAGADFVLPSLSESEIHQASLGVSGAASLPKFHRTDAEYRTMLNRIGDRLTASAPALCKHAEVEGCFMNIEYSPEDAINATASDNNRVTVYKGLLELLESEEETAAVVAHEFGHHLAQHLEEKRRNAMIGAILGGLAAAGAAAAAGADGGDPATQQAVGTWAGVGAGIGALSYSKEQEREADLLSAYLLARADYDLRRASRVWKVLAQQNKNKVRSTLFDTHPAGPERIAAWEKAIVEVEASPDRLPRWKP
jgi:predicted Zn-dependent protease